MSAQPVQLKIRVPSDVKRWLAAQAQRNGSSQTSEIIRVLRDQMERKAAHV